MKKLVLVTLLLASTLLASAQKNTAKSYIEQFKDDAIKIMHQTGVPASIVLGVAMHESGCGNSTLAQNLNNQFGVKGGGGAVFYKHNKKVHSKYKRYESVYDSFQDFARIMTERSEFSGLADKFTHFDYTGWAHGIQKHGYASSHKWSAQVLGLIKKYQLYNFDENPAEKENTANQDQMAQNN
ncbi:glucosaminidase domain-containing protein [Mucilaginibacter sp. OK098]|jgi:flagellum-specific peptidoglycan hydrolase FlgJ|uniref:glucosaminidase domain-containing protein n=1 Tax=Mucilaginibacter sp. OK098 TaxID=1855297 RepID=UPI00091E50E6|nr:glucosaminidase domain-containing protein [Mucilaginibacter sp. OK098]SHN30451.1 Flagellum-specific peptidoglycan hydrolase FlgJ [Mucilaginibacter sp. OK098]